MVDGGGVNRAPFFPTSHHDKIPDQPLNSISPESFLGVHAHACNPSKKRILPLLPFLPWPLISAYCHDSRRHCIRRLHFRRPRTQRRRLRFSCLRRRQEERSTMSREKKRGTSGNAVAFITRGKAMKKLQLTLKEFRRLCILKGIYPRNPRKKLEGTDKTYYLRKDIDFLAHERLIGTIRHENAHSKKVTKARHKKRRDLLKRLALSAPRARLDHLVVERYPRFEDAVRELDDPLCIISLFANLPAERRVGVSPRRVANCQRLFREFCHFVAETHALKKVFVSVKGYYFQAVVAGEIVTWVTPHRFSQVVPEDVDYSVMSIFLELYECILSFINFRLYMNRNYSYPPKVDRQAASNALELASLLIEKTPVKSSLSVAQELDDGDESGSAPALSKNAVKEAEKVALSVTKEEEEDSEAEEENIGEKDDNDEDGDRNLWGNTIVPQAVKPVCTVFAGQSFVLGREVPYIELEFVLKSTGAIRVTREDNLPEGEDRLEGYTHWIIDRPKIAGARNMSIEYVQPQFVFDSINAAVILPTSLYGPGTPLPPHLSPFTTEEDDGGYRPWFQDVLDRIKAGDESVAGEAAAVVYAEAEAKAKRDLQSSRESADAVNSDDIKENITRKRGTEDGETEEADNSDDDDGEAEEVEEDDDGMEEMEDVAEDDPVEDEGEIAGRDLPKDEDNKEEEDEEDDEDSDDEKDSEGEEERITNDEREKQSKEGKEMAKIMLSRKKQRAYNKAKNVERQRDSVRNKLMAKRKKLTEEAEETMDKKTLKKRRLQRLGMN